jgi:peptide deformylase
MSQKGSPSTAKLRGLLAQAFQHEHEHLEGKIFLDHLPEAQREWLRERLVAES